jgi:hypothetical protein
VTRETLFPKDLFIRSRISARDHNARPNPWARGLDHNQ